MCTDCSTTSLASSLLASKSLNLQTQIATRLLKENADAEKSTVLTLLNASPLANVSSGIGGQLDVRA